MNQQYPFCHWNKHSQQLVHKNQWVVHQIHWKVHQSPSPFPQMWHPTCLSRQHQFMGPYRRRQIHGVPHQQTPYHLHQLSSNKKTSSKRWISLDFHVDLIAQTGECLPPISTKTWGKQNSILNPKAADHHKNKNYESLHLKHPWLMSQWREIEF